MIRFEPASALYTYVMITSWFGIYPMNIPSVVGLLVTVNPGVDNPSIYAEGLGVSPAVITK